MRFPPNALGRAVAASLFLSGILLAVPAAAPGSVAGVGPLPECRLDDVLTAPRDYDDWAITQVDYNLTLGRNYRPPDLVSVSIAGIDGGGYIRKVAIDDLRDMADAARDNGTPIKVLSPFRDYRQQVQLFNSYAGWTGRRYTNFDNAVTFSARPGHSEHQTGLTIDFGSVGDESLTSNWHRTPAGAWMAEHAWKFGWLMSYPKGKRAVVCYRFEPWHYRYVGRDIAAAIHDSGLTIREYLWANYTQVDSACMALTPARLKTPGKPRSCALDEPAPSPGSSGPPPTSGTAPSGSPGAGAPSMGPEPIRTPGAVPSGPAGFLASIPAPALAAIAIGLALVAVLVVRGSRARR